MSDNSSVHVVGEEWAGEVATPALGMEVVPVSTIHGNAAGIGPGASWFAAQTLAPSRPLAKETPHGRVASLEAGPAG
jgi:hypothetical protein